MEADKRFLPTTSDISFTVGGLRLQIMAKQFSQVSVCMEEMRFYGAA